MTQRPDADNLSKAIVDVMTRLGFWHDDSMVNFHFIKYRCSSPCILVEIKVWKQEKEMVQ
jgi:Holliday junction resolvase RusA-like endonuclease